MSEEHTKISIHIHRTESAGKGSADASKSLSPDAISIEQPPGSTNIILEVTGVQVGILSEFSGIVEDSKKYPIRMFRLTDGHRFSAPRSVQVEDEVWLIYGENRPWLLRPAPGGHTLVRQVMVLAGMIQPGENVQQSDIMYGRMVDRIRKGEVNTARIRII